MTSNSRGVNYGWRMRKRGAIGGWRMSCTLPGWVGLDEIVSRHDLRKQKGKTRREDYE